MGSVQEAAAQRGRVDPGWPCCVDPGEIPDLLGRLAATCEEAMAITAKELVEDFKKRLRPFEYQNGQTVVRLCPRHQQGIPKKVEENVKLPTGQNGKASNIDSQAMNKYMQSACTNYHIAFVDTTPYFEATSASSSRVRGSTSRPRAWGWW